MGSIVPTSLPSFVFCSAGISLTYDIVLCIFIFSALDLVIGLFPLLTNLLAFVTVFGSAC